MSELLNILAAVFILVIVCGWIMSSGDRRVYDRPPPDTDPPEVRIGR